MIDRVLRLQRWDPSSPRLSALDFRLEELWLRVLPHLTRNYSWAAVDGFRMFGSTRHQRYLWRLRKGRVEPFTVHLFRELVRPGMVVVDVGAYLGYYTLLAARGTGPAGQVHAFECNPVNHRFLLHNLRLNGLEGHVVASPAAISDQAGALRFFVRGWDLSDGSLWQESDARRVVEAASTTLDLELGGQRVDVLKMDIEGGELRALEGMTTTVSASPNLVMFVECNPSALAAAGGSAAELIERLGLLGFDVAEIDEEGRSCRAVTKRLLATDSAENPELFVNLYCTQGRGGPRAGIGGPELGKDRPRQAPRR